MILDDVSDYLVAKGVVPSGWRVWKGSLPDAPDQAIALFQTGGWSPDTHAQENQLLAMMTRIRGSRGDYAETEAIAADIWSVLQNAHHEATSPALLPGYVYILCTHEGPLAFNDPEERPNFTYNWKIMKLRHP